MPSLTLGFVVSHGRYIIRAESRASRLAYEANRGLTAVEGCGGARKNRDGIESFK